MDAKGQSRGILIFWDNRALELLDMEFEAFLVSCRLRNCDDNFIWMFIRVYDLFWLRRGMIFGINWVLLEVFSMIPSAWEGISM